MSDTKQSQQSELTKSVARPPPKCPTCGAQADAKALPFCSSRCADVDLGNWLQGKYAVPAVDAEDDTIIEALLVGEMAPPQDDDDR